MAQKPVLGMILGDAAGVGSEIIAKLCAENFFAEYCRPVLVGDKRVLDRAFNVIGKAADIQVIEDVDDADWTKGIPMLDRKNVDPAEVPFGEGKVVSGAAVLDAIDLFCCQRTHHSGWYSYDQNSFRIFFILGNKGAGCHNGICMNMGAIHDDGTHANQYIVINGAAMDDGTVANCNIVPNCDGMALGAMHHDKILNICVGTNGNRRHISTQHGIVPDGTVFLYGNRACHNHIHAGIICMHILSPLPFYHHNPCSPI